MYEKVSAELKLVEREKQIEKFWKDNQIFEKSMKMRENCPSYTFYDGPPTANGIHLPNFFKKFFLRIYTVRMPGKGIEPTDLPHIFDRFYRADASRNTAAGGSGIGLSIVSKIIKDHGGTISAESTPGVGTIMHITMIKHKQAKPVPKRIDKE